jgi:alkylation response protein AidB-like acyl-CoA dehydrogenase
MTHIYDLDEAGQALTQHAAAVARGAAALDAAQVDAEARFPAAAITALAAEGFLGLCLPHTVGGRGEGPRTFAAVTEELARSCASTAMIYVMHVSAARAVADSGTLAGRDELLREIAAGRHLTTLALSEKGSRSQFWAPLSRLEPRDGRFVTSAYKSWVTAASHADSYVCSAQRPGAESPLESTLYLARRGAPGVTVQGRFDGLGLRGNDSAPVVIEGLEVAPGDLVTEQGAGAKAMLEVILPWFALGTAAMANGLSLAAVQATAEHLMGAGFEHSGEKLRDLPGLRARLAAMSVRTDQSRALLGYTLAQMDHPTEATPLYVLEARLAAVEAAAAVTDLALRAGGGAAFSKHLPLERLFRDARAGAVMAPTSDHLHDFIGRALTGLPLF